MAAAVVPAALQDIDEAVKVGFGVSVRVLQRVSHTGLGGQMYDDRKAISLEQRLHSGAIGQIQLEEREVRVLFEEIEARVLESRIIIFVDVVDADDRLPCPRANARPYESR